MTVAGFRLQVIALTREAWATSIAQPVASGVTVLVVIGMILTVMLTSGRTIGAEQKVLASIDTAGTRTLQVRAEADAGLTADVLTRIAHIHGIEWAAAFSAPVDATNTVIPDGARVPARLAYGSHLERLGVPRGSPLPGAVAYASPAALDLLGLPDVAGSITTTTGSSYDVVGQILPPEFLSGFEPAVFVPQPHATGSEAVAALVVITEDPALVGPVSDAVLSVLAVDDPTKVTIQTSEELAQLRLLVQSQLASFSRGLVLVTLATTGVLVAVILFGLVMMRRRDFGRRRALGATRGLIVALLLTQTAVLTLTGVGVGMVASTIALIASGDPLPGPSFGAAISMLTLATTIGAALLPAVFASTREPIRELRVA
ncbi:FtsX-like permease family protein [Microbacterium sp. B35-04]|jgi:putative ABC transport system permease protein|uniref:FtsX-like permease family protein n=1 Tax=Microbacterium sp. B35-04 TaxID=1961716 RepID=UPI0013D0B8A4|nr:FtsX-like permease family protein [Microbacterium sp. B35-04]